MKYLIFISSVLLVACGGEGKQHSGEIVCAKDIDAYFVQYSDGLYRKSERYVCANGCDRFVAVSDPSLTFSTCH